MNKYIDRSFIQNPLSEYVKWFLMKVKYQVRYFGSHLRIGYKNRFSNVTFGRYNWTGRNVVMSNVNVGDFTYFSDDCVILEADIGRFCSVGPNVRIAPGNHPTRQIVSTHPAIYSNPSYCLKNFSLVDQHSPVRHVNIGNDVWICANVIINDGVTVGDGAIIAANSVVVKDIEPFSIVSGLPAKHLRYRFEPHEIETILKYKWWEKDIAWLEKNSYILWDIKKYYDFHNS